MHIVWDIMQTAGAFSAGYYIRVLVAARQQQQKENQP